MLFSPLLVGTAFILVPTRSIQRVAGLAFLAFALFAGYEAVLG